MILNRKQIKSTSKEKRAGKIEKKQEARLYRVIRNDEEIKYASFRAGFCSKIRRI
jgi:hypothetical protein